MIKRRSTKIWKKSLAILLCALILVVGIRLIWFRPEQIEAAWYNDTWGFRVKLTIDHTKVAADQTDFPVYVDLSKLPAIFHAHVNQTDGRDIRVTTANGSTELPREVVFYDATSNKGELHFKYTGTLSSSTDTSVYIYFGNAGASDYAASDTYGKNNVWDSSFSGIHHLQNNSFADSTSGAHNGTNNGTTNTSGKAGDGRLIDANGEYFSVPLSGYIHTSVGTVDWWYKNTVSSANFLSFWGSNEGDNQFQFQRSTLDTSLDFIVNSSGANWTSLAKNVFDGSWHHIAVVYDTTNNTQDLYIDSVAQTQNIENHTDIDISTYALLIGENGAGGGNNARGVIDEFRVSNNLKRSSTWITTEYNNQSSPTTFFTTGATEQRKSAVLNLAFDEGYGTTVNDSSSNGYTGTLSGATTPSWQSESQCISGKCLYYQGSTAYTSIGTSVPNVQSVSFWVKPKTNAETLVDFDGGTHYISASAGTITATGFSSSTIYVNGKSGNTLTANAWQHIEVTTATAFTASAITIGKQSTNYLNGFIDEFTLYDYARSSSQVKLDFTSRSSRSGVGARFGPDTGNTLSNGLVGYWKMDEAAWGTPNCSTDVTMDSSGNGANGDACPTSTGPVGGNVGKFGKAVAFDGSDDYIPINGSTVYATMNSPFSASAWVNLTDFSTSNYPVVIALRSDDTDPWFIILSNQTNFLGVSIGNDNSFAGIKTDTPTASLTGAWHHIAVSYNGQGSGAMTNFKIYLDGQLQTNIASGTYASHSQTTSIGYNGGGNRWYGSIDEVRVYNRALSTSDVNQLYNWAPGPIGYWKMDENTGTTIYDTSGNGYNGTFQDSLTKADWKNGKYGSAVSFVGANKSILALHSTGFDFGTSTKFTVGTWVKVTADTGSQQSLINPTGVVSAGFELYTGSDGKLRAAIGSGTYCSIRNTGVTLEDNNWHYVEAVFNRGSGCTTASTQIYIDGKLEPTSVADSSGGADANIDMGGIKFTSSSTNDSVVLDNVIIYNYARTPGQIIEDMNAGHPAPGSPIGSYVAYWKFDEGALNTCSGGTNDFCDSSVNANDLAAPPTTTILTNAGKFGKAFNASGAVLATRADDSDFDFAAADDLSMSMWLYASAADKPTSGNVQYVYTKGGIVAAGTVGYILYTNSSGNVSFAIRSTSGNWVATPPAEPTSDDKVTSTTDLYDSTWHHIVVTKTGTSRIDLFVDGKLNASDTSLTATGTLENAVTSRFADRNETNDGDEFVGKIDEMKIYRLALNTDQVKVEYNHGFQNQLGALSTDASNNPSNSATDEYCPPGQGSDCTAPVGHWKLDENTGTSTVYDSSGNGRDGTMTNISEDDWATGKLGSGINFDNANDYVNIADNDAFSANTTNQLTVEAWVYLDALGITQEIVNKGAASNYEWAIRINTDGNTLAYLYQSGGGTYMVTPFALAAATNTWYHLALVADVSIPSLKLFINGKFAAEDTTASGSYTNGTAAVRIGDRVDGITDVDGTVDDVRIYNYARTPAQIAWDYNRGGPVGWWKLDENTGTAANDSMGNSTAGTLTNTPTWATGKLNQAISFAGSNQHVLIGDDPDFDFADDENMTLTAWFKHTTASTQEVILSKYAAAGYKIIMESDGDITCGLDYDATWTPTDSVTSTLATYDDDNWHHIACIKTGATSLELYIDGILITTDSSITATNTLTNADPIYLGIDADGTSNDFTGTVDDVRIYRYPLTPQQIKTVMGESAVRFGPLTGSP